MKKSILFLIILLLLYIVTLVFNLRYYWGDINAVFHILGGIGLGLFFYSYFRPTVFDSNIGRYLAVIGSVALVGILWEVAEFSAGNLLSDPIYNLTQVKFYFMGDLADTMTDLSLDLIGGSIAYLVARR